MPVPLHQARRYDLRELLGDGGQGRTYRALDTETGAQVAVKVIQLGSGGGWKPFDLFERECRVLRSLEHPGIPRYLDTFAVEEKGSYFLVMELVEGTSLLTMLRQRQLLSEPQLFSILHQVLDILEYLHGRRPPVIHRDLKPANLIRRADGRVALVDFGGVRIALRPEGGSTVIGTFGYMAPEQLHGEAGPAADIYGLGATLAAMAAGAEADRLPHQGLKIDLDAVMEPSRLRDVLHHMVEPDPSRRLGSVAAVRAALTQKPPAAEPPPPPPIASPYAGRPGGPVNILLRLIGSLGYMALLVVDAVILPLVFAMVSAAWSREPHKLGRLRQRQETARRVIRSGREVMGALAAGQDPYHPEAPGPRRLGRRERHGRHRLRPP